MSFVLVHNELKLKDNRYHFINLNKHLLGLNHLFWVCVKARDPNE